jgi:polar amino acid transport system substrate-binding protein
MKFEKMLNPFPKLIFALLASILSAPGVAAPLKFCYEDVPQKPWTMPDGTGLNITLLKRVEKLLGESFSYTTKPWSRCQEETRVGALDGYFAASITDVRRQYSVFPSLPDGSPDNSAVMYEDRFDVYLRKGGEGLWDGKQLRSPRHPIVAQRGYFVATVLRAHGLVVEESIKSAEDGLRLLSQNMADVVVLQGNEARDLATNDPRFKDSVVTTSTPYLVLPLYLAINRGTYLQNPKRIEAIWAAIGKVRNSPDYHTLLDAAGVR